MLTAITVAALVLLGCWNVYLHRRLRRESLERRELAVAFRQSLSLIERRSFPLAYAA